MAQPQHFLTLRPCIELLTVGGDSSPALLIPRGSIDPSSLAVLRLGEHFELRQSQSRSSSLLLLLSSGGLIVYLLYKSFKEDEDQQQQQQQTRPPGRQRWSAQNWLQWLLFGDTPDIRGQYFGPVKPHPQAKSAVVEQRQQLQKPNIVYVSPCPNCVRGVCKVRKHHQLLYHRQKYVPILESASTSGASTPCLLAPSLSDFKTAPSGTTASFNKTPDFSADDESSEDEELRQRLCKDSPSKKKKLSYSSSRVPPEGRDALKGSFRGMARDDESMDSICDGVSGSMVNLVKGAREVRRLIREASIDSLASDFSLDMQESLGSQTASNFDSIYHEVSRLKSNCEVMEDNIDRNVVSSAKMKASKSEFFKEPTPSLSGLSSAASLSSSPDLRNLHKIIHSAPRNKALWTLTHNTGFSDNDSNCSPIHGTYAMGADFAKDSRYKIINISSNTSECGEWEWDSEGLSSELMTTSDFFVQGGSQETWLQDDPIMELDLEAELLSSTANFKNKSSLSDAESSSSISLYNKVRLPPSGRSSVMSGQENSFYQDKFSMSRSSSCNSLKNLEGALRKGKKSFAPGYSSDESGIEDKSTDYSMKSSVVVTPLSPVREVKESPNKTPKVTSTERKSMAKVRRRLNNLAQ